MARFFQSRQSPSRDKCDERALSILKGGFKSVRPVDNQGSLSYTVIGTTSVIISFRREGSKLDADMIKLSEEIHGDLAPAGTYFGTIGETSAQDPPLSIYLMPFLPGASALNALAFSPKLDDVDEAKHTRYVKDLAQYFARCWNNPQPIDPAALKAHEQDTRRKLQNLKEQISTHPYPADALDQVERNLYRLFDRAYPQVLTHRDLSLINVLLREEDLATTGIVDWSLASILPFGMDLDVLRLTTGNMDLRGWFDYECRGRLDAAFWDEFWGATGLDDGDGDDDKTKRESIRDLAEITSRLAAILRYAFKRGADGSDTDAVAPGPAPYLWAWFRDGD